MSKCCAYGCTNRPEYKTPGITFHLFPKDPVRRKAWTAAVKRKNFVPTDLSKLCSEHFEEDCFDRTKKKVHLLPHAVPSIFETQPKSLSRTESPTEFQNNGTIFKRSLSDTEEDDEEEEDDEDGEDEDDQDHLLMNENYEDSSSSSSSSESSEENEPEATPETEVVYVSEEPSAANKPSIIKVVPGPGQSDPSRDPDIRSALQAYQRLRSNPAAPTPSVVSVLFVAPPHADALPPLPPGARPPGDMEYRVWNQCKKIREIGQANKEMVRKIRELERRIEQFRNPVTSDEDEEEDVSEGEAYRLLLKHQKEEEEDS